MLPRRIFLRASAVAMAGVGLEPAWLVRAAAQAGNNRKKILIFSFTTWSKRTLVELSELGLDQLAMYSAKPDGSVPLGEHGGTVGSQDITSSGRFGNGNAFNI